MKKLLFVICIVTVFSGCSRIIDCNDPSISLSFVSFPPNSLNDLVIRKFGKDSNFQNLIDTLSVTTNVGRIINRGDTADIRMFNPDNFPKPGFDWQIYIPSINRTITITEINKRDKTASCPVMQSPENCICNNEILDLQVNNQAGVFQTGGGYSLLIR